MFQGSECDKLGGFDGATLPPGLGQSDVIDMFISLMCRKIELKFEKVGFNLQIKSKMDIRGGGVCTVIGNENSVPNIFKDIELIF